MRLLGEVISSFLTQMTVVRILLSTDCTKRLYTSFFLMNYNNCLRTDMITYANNELCVVKRRGLDRRIKEMPIFSKDRLSGRRESARRKEDRQGFYQIDRYDCRILAPIVVIVAFSLLDAILTLYLIGRGAVELNPLMAYFLDHGPLAFIWAKHLLTCTSLVILLVHKNAFLYKTRFRAEILFRFFPLPFVLVVWWQIYLILVMNLHSL